MLYRTEFVGRGFATTPYALDRNVWWPLIEKEGWSHRTVLALLEVLDRALYAPLPTDATETEDDDDE